MKLYLISDNLTHQPQLLEDIDIQELWFKTGIKPILCVESACYWDFAI